MPTLSPDLVRASRAAFAATRKVWPTRWPENKPHPTETLYADEQLAIHKDASKKHSLARKLARQYGETELAQRHYGLLVNHRNYVNHGMGGAARIRPVSGELQKKYLEDLTRATGDYASMEYNVAVAYSNGYGDSLEVTIEEDGEPDTRSRPMLLEYVGTFQNHHMVRVTDGGPEGHQYSEPLVKIVNAIPAAVFAALYI